MYRVERSMTNNLRGVNMSSMTESLYIYIYHNIHITVFLNTLRSTHGRRVIRHILVLSHHLFINDMHHDIINIIKILK